MKVYTTTGYIATQAYKIIYNILKVPIYIIYNIYRKIDL